MLPRLKPVPPGLKSRRIFYMRNFMSIVVGDKLIGAIGVSGGAPAQDNQVAQVGAAAIK